MGAELVKKIKQLKGVISENNDKTNNGRKST